jgi:hypothetical protein
MLGSSFLLIFWHLVRGAVLGILNLRHDSPHLVLRGCNFTLAFEVEIKKGEWCTCQEGRVEVALGILHKNSE